MAGPHKKALVRKFPPSAPKVRTLAEVAEGAVQGDVEDPIGLGQEAYERTAATLERGLSVLAGRMLDLLRGVDG
jgi:protein-tyrosine-phosphatase